MYTANYKENKMLFRCRRFLVIFIITISIVTYQSGSAFADNGQEGSTTSLVYGVAAIGVAGLAVAIVKYFSGAKPSPESPVPEEKDTRPLISPASLEIKQPEISNVVLESSSLRSVVTSQIHYLEYVLNNRGKQTLDISKVDGFEGEGDNTITRDESIPTNCQQTLEPNETCTIRLAVAITKEGEISKKINIGNNDVLCFTAPIKFSVIPAPIPPAPLEVKQPEISNVELEPSSLRSVTPQIHYLKYILSNKCDQPLDISKIDGFEGEGDNTITRDGSTIDESIPTNCQQTLEPKETCTVKLAVAITKEGEISKKINIGNNDALYFTAPIKFSVIPAPIPLDPLEVKQPETSNVVLKSSRQRSVTSQIHYLEYILSNKYDQPLDISRVDGFEGEGDITITRDNSVLTNCQRTLEPNETCTIRLAVAITKEGEISKKINIGNNDTTYFTVPIKLSVVKPTALVAITKSLQLEFAEQPEIKSPMKLIGKTGLGDSIQTLEYTIKNTGYEDIKNLNIGGYSTPIKRDYTIEDNCGTTLASGASCKIRLIANPTIAKPISQKLSITATDSSKDINKSQNIKITSPIEIAVNYEPYYLITKDKVKLDALVLFSLTDEASANGFKAIKDFSRKHGQLPVLIKNGNNFSVYGCLPNNNGFNLWGITEIEHNNIFKDLPFTENEASIITRDDPRLTKDVVEAVKIGHPMFQIYPDLNFTFTTPLVINAIDENIESGVFVGTDNGTLRWSKNDGAPSWVIIFYTGAIRENHREVVSDIHAMGSYVYTATNLQIFDEKWHELEQPFSIKSSHYFMFTPTAGYDWMKPLYSYEHAEGIRRVGEKVFITDSNRIGIEDADFSSGAEPLAPKTFRETNPSKLHGEGNNLCVGTKNGGIFTSHDLGKKWNSYNAKTSGFASSNVLVVHCDQSNFYAGTDKGLSISKDNGTTWKTSLEGRKIYGVYAKDGNVWAATEKKLFSSKDNGENWIGQELALGDYTMVFFPVYKEYNELEHIKAPEFTEEDSKQEIAQEKSLSNEDLMAVILNKPENIYRNHRILGVSIEERDCKVIKEAYRARYLKCHPDKNKGNEAASEAFKLLSTAYESLSKEFNCKK